MTKRVSLIEEEIHLSIYSSLGLCLQPSPLIYASHNNPSSKQLMRVDLIHAPK